MAHRTLGITTKGIALISALLLVTNVALAVMLSSQSEQALAEQIQARMTDVSTSAAALLDGDKLEKLTANDTDSPAYQEALRTLAAFQDSVELSYIYCLRQTGEHSFEFTVDPTEADPADFGEPATYTEALGKAATGVTAVDLVPYTDRWGRFYSAYSPVFDSSGNVASVVGVDFSASWYEERITRMHRLVASNCVASFAMAMLAMLGASRITAAKRRHARKMRHAALYDSLTELPKMGHFFDLAGSVGEKLQKQGAESAILYTDFAGMKYLNQRQGFAEGDRLLKEFACLLAEHFDRDRCGRLGQDHFAVITSADDLDARIEELIDDCGRINEGNSLPVRIGIYRGTIGKGDVSTACDRAKAASEAHQSAYHSSYAYFNDDMLTTIERRQYVTSSLDRAIEEQWIQVYYQPIIRTANGRVCDEEALARWIDPERGMLSPAEFIPALEDTKLVYKLDLYVLEQTLAKMHLMAEKGLFVVPASVNLSRSDFEMCDMVEEVRKRVDASGIKRDMINVEITESAIGGNLAYMGAQIDRFRGLGFHVWMDDFGSEYSSLDYLQSLNFDLIKFDMRFMQQFDNNDKSKVILTELTRMANGLGVETIVEGVERQDQVDFLREIGCDKLQGYFFTRPLPLEEIFERYETGTAIGLENPAESEYYAALGHVSLYDFSSITRDEDESLRHYFDTLPMVIVESTGDELLLVRANKSYRQLMQRNSSLPALDTRTSFTPVGIARDDLRTAVRESSATTERIVADIRTSQGVTAHVLLRKVAVNPVTHTIGVAVAILDMSDDTPA